MNTLLADLREIKQRYTSDAGLWVMIAGLSVMFIPTFYDLIVTTGIWMDDVHAHGPYILGISLWLLWKRWREAPGLAGYKPAPKLAWMFFVIAAALYIPGRSLDIIYFESGAFIFAMAGIVAMEGGLGLLKAVRFPLIFMIFMIPPPNSIIGPITELMKMAVSTVTVDVLSWAGLPAAQSGVLIILGQYHLLVADACAGMRTLFMLESFGVLYLNIVVYHSKFRNILLPILIIPISFTANVIRVIALSLITYYFGDEAGQGFLHQFAGIVLFMTGLLIMMGTDSLLRLISRKYHGT
jgi:exosortase B